MKTKIIDLLTEFYNTRSPKFLISSYWDKTLERKKEFWSNDKDVGPHSFEDATTWKSILPLKFGFVPEKFYNKRIKVGDYEIIIQYEHELPKRSDNFGNDFSMGIKREAYAQYKTLNVIVCFHGLYLSLGKFRESNCTVVDYCKAEQTNYRQSFKDGTKPYMMREYNYKQEFDYYEPIVQLMKLMNMLTLELKGSDIGFQPWYSSYAEKEKTLRYYSQRDLDFNWFLSQETVGGIFKPEKSTIDNIWAGYVPGKKLLKEAGVHTVQLRANCHFNISKVFDLKEITLKAPKSVIKTYGLEKYCNDESVVKKIKEEDEQVLRDENLKKYNDQFTLMQHGKVILEDKPKWDIIQYLESNKSAEFEPEIIKNIQPVFDHFKDINKLYLGKWGQYSQYESRGVIMDFNCEVDDMNAKLMSSETHRELYELFENNIYMDFDEKLLEIKYGWPEMSFNRIGVEKTSKGKLKVFVENYHD